MDAKISLLSLLFLVYILVERTNAGPYFEDALTDETRDKNRREDGGNGIDADSDYSDNALENLMRAAEQKRGCIRRDGNCDHRPNDCCYSSSCRCNLWGSNCRCQRMGLFQKWG